MEAPPISIGQVLNLPHFEYFSHVEDSRWHLNLLTFALLYTMYLFSYNEALQNINTDYFIVMNGKFFAVSGWCFCDDKTMIFAGHRSFQVKVTHKQAQFKVQHPTTSLFVRPSKISADNDSSGMSDVDSDAWYFDATCGFAVFVAMFSEAAENAAMVCATSDFS